MRQTVGRIVRIKKKYENTRNKLPEDITWKT